MIDKSSRSLYVLPYAAIVLLMLLAITGYPAQAQVEPQKKQWNVMLLIDQSGSMFLESDPCQFDSEGRLTEPPLRNEAVMRFIDLLGIDSAVQHEVGIAYFGLTASLEDPFFQAHAAENVKARLKSCPPNMGWTNINAALKIGYEQLMQKSDDDARSVVLLTDGVPELAAPWSIDDKQRYYDEHFDWIAKYRQAGIKIFVIALGERATRQDADLSKLRVPPGLEAYQDIWVHAVGETNGQYYAVDESTDLWSILHAIASLVLDVTPGWTQGGRHEGERTNIAIQVPRCSRMIVSVDRAQETTSTLFDPQGNLEPTTIEETTYQIYSVERPASGGWTLRFDGPPTSYVVRMDCESPIKLFVEDAPSVWPLGKPMPLKVRVLSESLEPETKASVHVQIELPDGSLDTPLSLAHTGEGLYTGVWRGTQRGRHALEFRASEGESTAIRQRTVILEQLLYLDLRLPEAGERYQEDPIGIQVAVMRGLSPQEGLPIGQDAPVVQASLRDRTGSEVANLILADDGRGPDDETSDGVYAGLLSGIPDGAYTLVVTLDAPTENTRDQVSAQFEIEIAVEEPIETPPPTPAPCPHMVLRGGSDLGEMRAGNTVSLPIEYNTQGRSVADELPFSLSVAPVEPNMVPVGPTDFTIGRPAEHTLLLPPGEQGERDIVILVSKEIDIDAPTAYQGQISFACPDGTTEETTFSLTVVPPGPEIPIWPFIVLAAVLGGGGSFVYFDPLCLRCRLRGQLVYQRAPGGYDSEPFPLGGRRQTVSVTIPRVQHDLSGPEGLDEAQEMIDYGPPQDFDFGVGGYDATFEETKPLSGAVPDSFGQGVVTLRFRAQRSDWPLMRIEQGSQEVRKQDVLVEKGREVDLRHGETISVGEWYELVYEHPKHTLEGRQTGLPERPEDDFLSPPGDGDWAGEVWGDEQADFGTTGRTGPRNDASAYFDDFDGFG